MQNKTFNIIIISLFLLLFFTVEYGLIRYFIDYKMDNERYVFSVDTKNGFVDAKGYYSGNGYFCIATLNRSLDEIMATTTHELVHVMVREERVHFNVESEVLK